MPEGQRTEKNCKDQMILKQGKDGASVYAGVPLFCPFFLTKKKYGYFLISVLYCCP